MRHVAFVATRQHVRMFLPLPIHHTHTSCSSVLDCACCQGGLTVCRKLSLAAECSQVECCRQLTTMALGNKLSHMLPLLQLSTRQHLRFVYATCYTTLTYVLVLDCVRCWCRQYMDNGMRIDSKDMSKLVSETWRTLTSKERSPYEKRARSETLQYEEERRVFEKKHKIWADLQHKAKASG